MSPARTRLAYRIATGLFCLGILPGGVMDIVQPQMVIDIATKLQIPLAILTLIGIWKLLGVVALLQPRFQRINEWAYAGFTFDLIGAAWWHGSAGDWAGVAPPLVLLIVLAVSYRMRDLNRAL